MAAFLTLVSSALLLANSALAQTCTPCDDVHFFLARGNNEPYPGRQGDLVATTCDGVKGCGYENLIYSALYTDLSCQTTYDGCIAGHTQLTAYADRCPNSKLILAGYSQGAQIVTDILGGGGGVSFNGCVQPPTAALDRTKSPGNRLSAVIAVGNTRHTANQPYNYGNGSSMDGLFPKTGSQLSDIAAYSDIMRDWCLSPDPICAGNQTYSNVAVHLGYYRNQLQEFADWIRSVAKITPNADFHTAIPTQVSGTVNDYKTIASGFTPSGTVTLASVTTAPVSCSGGTTSSSTIATSSAPPQSQTVTSDTVVKVPTTAAPSGPATPSRAASANGAGSHASHDLAIISGLWLLFGSFFV